MTGVTRGLANIICCGCAALAGFLAALTLGCGGAAAEFNLRPGTRIAVVSTLADGGSGSLRLALALPGPKLIVFSVSGIIRLDRDLSIETDGVHLAGETAPGQGIVLAGASLRIRASHVRISHIGVYAGATADRAKADSRDSISIYGQRKRGTPIAGITLSHITAAWGVDENIGVQGLVDGVRIERSLIAEGLTAGGHPKGSHSMNLLLGNTVKRAEILGNVFAFSLWRSPRVTQGNTVAIINNLVVGYGLAATQIDPTTSIRQAGAIDVIGNAYLPGPLSLCKRPAIDIKPEFFAAAPATAVHIAGNLVLGATGRCAGPAAPDSVAALLAPGPLVPVVDWPTRPAAALHPAILDAAGARPLARNPIDARIVAAIRAGSMAFLANEQALGGLPEIRAEAVAPPDLPAMLATPADVAKTKAFLCRSRARVGDAGRC